MTDLDPWAGQGVIKAKLDEILDLLKVLLVREGVTPKEETEADEVAAPSGPSIVEGTQAGACTHQHQAIQSGHLVCSRCGYDFGATGIGAHVAGSETREGRR